MKMPTLCIYSVTQPHKHSNNRNLRRNLRFIQINKHDPTQTCYIKSSFYNKKRRNQIYILAKNHSVLHSVQWALMIRTLNVFCSTRCFRHTSFKPIHFYKYKLHQAALSIFQTINIKLYMGIIKRAILTSRRHLILQNQ